MRCQDRPVAKALWRARPAGVMIGKLAHQSSARCDASKDPHKAACGHGHQRSYWSSAPNRWAQVGHRVGTRWAQSKTPTFWVGVCYGAGPLVLWLFCGCEGPQSLSETPAPLNYC